MKAVRAHKRGGPKFSARQPVADSWPFPYVAGEGTRLFDGVPRSYQLDLVSSAASRNGVIDLRYRRHRQK